jgi:hypothetical protein
MKTKTIRLTRKVVTPMVTSVAKAQTESDASFQELHTIWNRATPNGKQVMLETIRAIAHIPGMASDKYAVHVLCCSFTSLVVRYGVGLATLATDINVVCSTWGKVLTAKQAIYRLPLVACSLDLLSTWSLSGFVPKGLEV